MFPMAISPREEIRCCVFEAVDFLARMDIKALVVACNTATSAAIQDIRQKYGFPIIGMEPAVKPAIKSVDGKRVLVFATPLTLRESKFIGLLTQVDIHNTVDFLPLQELVTFAEAYQFDRAVILSYLNERLKDYDLNRYGAVVLGCTHFPFFKNHIREIFPKGTVIVDGNRGTVQNLKNTLASMGKIHEGRARWRTIDPAKGLWRITRWNGICNCCGRSRMASAGAVALAISKNVHFHITLLVITANEDIPLASILPDSSGFSMTLGGYLYGFSLRSL